MRILLAEMSNMLSTIVTAVIAQIPDSVVAGRVAQRDSLFAEIGLTSADVVVLQDSGAENADRFAALLRQFPTLRVLAINADGSTGFLHEMRPCTVFLSELSADVLQTALRGDQTLAAN